MLRDVVSESGSAAKNCLAVSESRRYIIVFNPYPANVENMVSS